jgi:hypothetical protein
MKKPVEVSREHAPFVLFTFCVVVIIVTTLIYATRGPKEERRGRHGAPFTFLSFR